MRFSGSSGATTRKYLVCPTPTTPRVSAPSATRVGSGTEQSDPTHPSSHAQRPRTHRPRAAQSLWHEPSARYRREKPSSRLFLATKRRLSAATASKRTAKGTGRAPVYRASSRGRSGTASEASGSVTYRKSSSKTVSKRSKTRVMPSSEGGDGGRAPDEPPSGPGGGARVDGRTIHVQSVCGRYRPGPLPSEMAPVALVSGTPSSEAGPQPGEGRLRDPPRGVVGTTRRAETGRSTSAAAMDAPATARRTSARCAGG